MGKGLRGEICTMNDTKQLRRAVGEYALGKFLTYYPSDEIPTGLLLEIQKFLNNKIEELATNKAKP